MIYRLTGTISDILEDGVVLKAGAIEWYIETSKSTLSRLPRDGREVSLLTYLHHREDLMQLFGFFDRKEKELFHSLMGVQGIGPRVALKYLSGITPIEFITAIENEDLGRLELVPGLGKKTAQKILLALAGKLRLEQGDTGLRNDLQRNPTIPTAFGELEDALVAMGYDRRLAREVLPETVMDMIQAQDGSVQSLQEAVERVKILDKKERDTFESEILRRCIIALR
ncbi:MAG: Holliday junction branch migration protein RuvA [Spirochaetales bacterium]|nr:Holliday junction branch migration protein RuvA [Spirochaetales bacterium]